MLVPPPMVTFRRFTKIPANVWAETIPRERKELLGVLLDPLLADMADYRIVPVKPEASLVALFQWVPGLEEWDGCSHLAADGHAHALREIGLQNRPHFHVWRKMRSQFSWVIMFRSCSP